MRRLKIEAEMAVSMALHIAEASTEHELFAAMLDAMLTIKGETAFRAYVLDMQHKSIRLSADLGSSCFQIDEEEVKRWLLQDGPEPTLELASGYAFPHACAKLVSGDEVLGGFLVGFLDTGSEPVTELLNLDLINDFARLGAAALVQIRKKRLSTMVLEALEKSEEAIAFYGEDGEGVIFTNDAYHRVFPHYPSRQEIWGKQHLELYKMDLEAGIISDPFAVRDPVAYLDERRELEASLIDRQREIQKLGGKTYIYTRSRSVAGAIMSRRIDITEQAIAEARLREREKQLQSLVYRDSLTGLYNRAYFLEHIEKLSAQMNNGELEAIAVLWIDLNGFKFVNDTYGHHQGDSVLRKIGRRLHMGLVDSDVVVRYGGDEFVILFEKAIPEKELEEIANRILAIISAPINLNLSSFQIGASIGIAKASGQGVDLNMLLGDADLAMYEAKKQSESSYRFFDPEMRSRMMERHALVKDIEAAFENEQFEVHFQPQFDTQTKSLVGFEALARWNHPTKGYIPPDLFIPVLEENNLIEKLGRWVLVAACEEAKRWPRDLFVAVNVSPLQISNSHFSLTISRALANSGLKPKQLELEITESALLDGSDEERAQIESWKSLGVSIALDDVGKGYSSLSYLSDFPFDKIKIDRSFLNAFDACKPEDAPAVILHAIVELGRTLGKIVIAEGVERLDQLEFLKSIYCEQVQGFYLGRPMDAKQARKFIRQARVSNWLSNARSRFG
nr:EAL domain-containing protein [uncultured Cohaesibacter sp.]